MARARPTTEEPQGLYERDFCLWLEQQAALLREGCFAKLDLANLVEEIEALTRKDKKAVKNNLIVLLTHLLKHEFQPTQRSSSWRGSILEHRRRCVTISKRARAFARTRPMCSLVPTPTPANRRASRPGCRSAAFPSQAPYTLEQTLDPKFLPD